jgi:transcriptional regulator with XRE-family HTH domain
MKVRLRIKELAQAKGMLQKDVAAKSGVTLQLLNRYWHNHIQNVNLEQLGNIAQALGVKAGDLIESAEEIENVA